MNKKDLLITVIKKLQGKRDLADAMLALLETADIDEKTIDQLIHIIAQSIKNSRESVQKALLEKSLRQIHSIQKRESNEQLSGEELEHILDEIA